MRKVVRLGHRTLDVQGVGDADPYFVAIGDGFEDHFSMLSARLLRPDDVVLDIGANIGITALVMSECVPDGHVHAFEAGPSVFSALKGNIERNRIDNISLYDLAIAETPGRVGFHDASAWGHISPGQPDEHFVRATTIDEIVAERRIAKIDFIKLDIEGFEQAALKGGVRSIGAFQPLIYMEYNSWCQVCWSRTNPLQFSEWLMANFQLFYVHDEGENPRFERVRKDAYTFTHDNMVLRGCVENILVTNNEARIASLL